MEIKYGDLLMTPLILSLPEPCVAEIWECRVALMFIAV